MNKLITYIAALFALSGCSNSSQKNEIAKVVEGWQGKFIKFPEKFIDFVSEDTLDISKADFTILTYIDSAGCTGCKMKLPLWREFLNSVNTISVADIQALMVVHTNDTSKLRNLLERYPYDYDFAVYIDTDDNVNKHNLFPTGTIYQTFLLDRNKKVVAIGNPTLSPAIATVYKSIVSGKRIFNTNVNSLVTLSENFLKLKGIKTGETITQTVKLTNHGNDTIFIKDILTSCECTKANVSESFIIPYGEADVDITYTRDSTSADSKESMTQKPSWM